MAKLADRVKQLCDATFTGTSSNIRIDYTDTAMNGYRRFSDVIALDTAIYYVCESTDSTKNEWELGVGTYQSEVISSTSRRTITRTGVIAGSNGTSKVNFTSGEKVVYIAALSRTLDGLVKNTFEGMSEDPNETYDANDGYSDGSMAYHNGKLFLCTDNSSGAAVWEQVATLGAGSSPTYVALEGELPSSFDDTPFTITSVKPGGDFGIDFKQPYMFMALVTAYSSSSDLTKGWRVTAVARLDGDGTAVLIGTPEITAYGDTGTETWAVTLQQSANDIAIQGTGDATDEVRWNISVFANRAF